MDYLSSLKKTTTDMTYKVVKKTEELIETSKLKYRIYDLKMEMEKIQKQIGSEVYNAYVEEPEVSDTVEEKCRKIDELKEKMDVLKAKLKEEQDGKRL